MYITTTTTTTSCEVLGIVPVLYPQGEAGPSSFSLGILCVSSLLAYISMPVWVRL
jgi:hypothetical protein